jgi:hypothetical protein
MRGTAVIHTLFALAVVSPLMASAQQLPAASRTVYKCNASGKVVYSDAPCLGAEKLEIEPTRGLASASGRKAVGADVQRERHREALADALKPLTGKNAKEFEQYSRRSKLSVSANQECTALDKYLAAAEREESRTNGPERREVQERLFGMRTRYRELRC